MFFISGPDYYSSRSFKTIWDQGHIIFYTLFVYFLLRFSPWFGSLSFTKQIRWGLLITISTGIIIELIQINFTRIPEAGDIWRDCLGCLFALVFFSKSNIKISAKIPAFLKILLVILVIIEFSIPLKALVDEKIAQSQFPLLSGFETPFETERWEPGTCIKRVNNYASKGKYSAEISFTTEKYSGVSLKYFPRNWSKYRYLHFSVYNTAKKSLQIILLIHDMEYIARDRQPGDRYNKKLILRPGWNHVRIPLLEIQSGPSDRLLNVSHILSTGIFVSRLKNPQTVYLDEIRLE
jgi:hypothetical protein